MRTINDWLALAQRGIKIVGLEYYTPDRIRVLAQFHNWGQELHLPVFFWNSGYSCLQEIVSQDGQCILQNTDLHPDSDVLEFLLESKREGIYILEGVLDFDESGQVSSRLGFQLANAY